MNMIDKINLILLGDKNKYLIENCANPFNYQQVENNLNKQEVNFVSEVFMNRIKNYTIDL